MDTLTRWSPTKIDRHTEALGLAMKHGEGIRVGIFQLKNATRPDEIRLGVFQHATQRWVRFYPEFTIEGCLFFDDFVRREFDYEPCAFERFGDDIYLVSGESCELLCHLTYRWWADAPDTLTPRINSDIDGVISLTTLEAIALVVWEESTKGLQELMNAHPEWTVNDSEKEDE